MKIKTIDIIAKEWFDKINGNSYFSGTITLNFGMKDVETMIMPFQYGYGSHYVDSAKAQLTEHNKISPNHMESLWCYCRDNKIILRTTKNENCKKRELTC